jgi:hypothetical protein
MAISLGIYPIFRQTHIYLSIYLSIYYVCHWKWMKWMDHFHWKCFTRCPTPTERWPSPEPIGSDLKDIEHWNHWTFIWKISGCWSDSFILFILYNTVYIYMFHLFIGKNSVSSSPNFGIFWHSWLTKQYNTMQSTDSWFQKFENWIARSNHLWISMVSLPEAPIFCFGPWPLAPQGGLWSFSSLSSFHSLVSSKVTKS